MGLFRSNCIKCEANIDWFLKCEGGITCSNCKKHNTEEEIRNSWNKNYAKVQEEIKQNKNTMKTKSVNLIEVSDWDGLVEKTYGRPYSFQQQEDCKPRGTFNLTVPCDYTEDEEMHDSVPETINGSQMGVKFKVWLERDPKEWGGSKKDESFLNLFWDRNFYPCVYTVANDLHKKGLLDAGEYLINIDW